jgi:hypothetical protein
MDEKILCYELTHHAGAHFTERAARHNPELLEMILPNGEKFVNTCPLCDKDTQGNNGTHHLDTAQHLFHECHECDDLRKNLRQNIESTLLTYGLNTYEAAEGTEQTMEEHYFYTGRVPMSLRQIIKTSGTHKESTIETIGGKVHSHLLTFLAEALKRRSEAITPDGKHDIKAAWTEQKKKPHPKGDQTPDANKNPWTPNNPPTGEAGTSSANGRELAQNTTGQTTHNTQGPAPKSTRKNGPLFYDPGERHNQGTPNGKKPRTQDITEEEWSLFEDALKDYLDPSKRELFIKAGLTPPSFYLTPTKNQKRTPNLIHWMLSHIRRIDFSPVLAKLEAPGAVPSRSAPPDRNDRRRGPVTAAYARCHTGDVPRTPASSLKPAKVSTRRMWLKIQYRNIQAAKRCRFRQNRLYFWNEQLAQGEINTVPCFFIPLLCLGTRGIESHLCSIPL